MINDIKLKQTKIPITISDSDDLLAIAVEQGVIENEFNWKLVRERDGLTKQSKGFTWQTTLVTEIIEQREDYIKFKTGNSNYELFKL